jgi:hypothetical protein
MFKGGIELEDRMHNILERNLYKVGPEISSLTLEAFPLLKRAPVLKSIQLDHPKRATNISTLFTRTVPLHYVIILKS